MNTELFESFISGLADVLNACADRVILYGSVARGTDTPESDVDIALILRRKLTFEEEDRLLDLITELNLKYDVVLSTVDIDAQLFAEWSQKLPFYRNIQNEGRVLWNAA